MFGFAPKLNPLGLKPTRLVPLARQDFLTDMVDEFRHTSENFMIE